MQIGGHVGTAGAQQRHDEGVRIELALVRGADYASENLLGCGAAPRAISSADFTCDHRGAEGRLGAPGGRINGPRIQEEREERREPDGEMRGEALHIGHRSWPLQPSIHARDQLAAPDRHAVPGDLARLASIAQHERLLQHRADISHEVACG